MDIKLTFAVVTLTIYFTLIFFGGWRPKLGSIAPFYSTIMRERFFTKLFKICTALISTAAKEPISKFVVSCIAYPPNNYYEDYPLMDHSLL